MRSAHIVIGVILGVGLALFAGCGGNGNTASQRDDIDAADDRTITAAMQNVDKVVAAVSKLKSGSQQLTAEYERTARPLVDEYRRAKDKAILDEIAAAGFGQLLRSNDLTGDYVGLDTVAVSDLEKPVSAECPGTLKAPVDAILDALKAAGPDTRIPGRARQSVRAFRSELARTVSGVGCRDLAVQVRASSRAP